MSKEHEGEIVVGLEAKRMAKIIIAETRDLMDELVNVAGSRGYYLPQPKRTSAVEESIAKLIQLAIDREVAKLFSDTLEQITMKYRSNEKLLVSFRPQLSCKPRSESAQRLI